MPDSETDFPSPSPELVQALQRGRAEAELPEVVRRVAQRWVEGLRALLGVAGVAGIVGAPFAIESLSDGTRRVVGAFLAGVIVCGATGLLLVMSAAYGGTRTASVNKSRDEIRSEEAQRGLNFLRTGRALTVASFFLLAAAVVWAWASPTPSEPAYVIVQTTAGGEHCGIIVPAPDAHLGVQSAHRPDGIDIPVAEILSVQSTDNC